MILNWNDYLCVSYYLLKYLCTDQRRNEYYKIKLMDIFKNIHAALPSKLLMVGDGPERPLAEDLTRQYGLEADVRFLGKQEKTIDQTEIVSIKPATTSNKEQQVEIDKIEVIDEWAFAKELYFSYSDAEYTP